MIQVILIITIDIKAIAQFQFSNMNTNKRKSTNTNNKDSSKKHKQSKNDPKLIQCMSCQQYVKRISQHFVRRKDCLQHYNESNSLYAPQVTKNIDTSTINKSKQIQVI